MRRPIHARGLGGAGRRRRQTEADRTLAARGGRFGELRRLVEGISERRDPAAPRDGGRRHRGAQGLPGGPAARRVRPTESASRSPRPRGRSASGAASTRPHGDEGRGRLTAIDSTFSISMLIRKACRPDGTASRWKLGRGGRYHLTARAELVAVISLPPRDTHPHPARPMPGAGREIGCFPRLASATRSGSVSSPVSKPRQQSCPSSGRLSVPRGPTTPNCPGTQLAPMSAGNGSTAGGRTPSIVLSRERSPRGPNRLLCWSRARSAARTRATRTLPAAQARRESPPPRRSEQTPRGPEDRLRPPTAWSAAPASAASNNTSSSGIFLALTIISRSELKRIEHRAGRGLLRDPGGQAAGDESIRIRPSWPGLHVAI